MSRRDSPVADQTTSVPKDRDAFQWRQLGVLSPQQRAVLVLRPTKISRTARSASCSAVARRPVTQPHRTRVARACGRMPRSRRRCGDRDERRRARGRTAPGDACPRCRGTDDRWLPVPAFRTPTQHSIARRKSLAASAAAAAPWWRSASSTVAVYAPFADPATTPPRPHHHRITERRQLPTSTTLAAELSQPRRSRQSARLPAPGQPRRTSIVASAALVPPIPPSSAVVCAAILDYKGELTGRRVLGGASSSPIPDDLAQRPASNPAMQPCADYLSNTRRLLLLLIGLTYPHGGLVWVAAPESTLGDGASNGAFITNNLSGQARTPPTTAGVWSPSPTSNPQQVTCPVGGGRLGQEKQCWCPALRPPAQICTFSTARRIVTLTPGQTNQLAAALDVPCTNASDHQQLWLREPSAIPTATRCCDSTTRAARQSTS